MKTSAYIPARSGSSRIKNKNIRDFCGHPLLAYTIQQAKDANLFDSIIVSTDSYEISEVAKKYGAKVVPRPVEISGDDSVDFEWVRHTIMCSAREKPDIVVIMRPTNPFRKVSTIHYAVNMLLENPKYDSVRAISPVKQHPCKMWRLLKYDNGTGQILPFMPIVEHGVKPYDRPTQQFTPIWCQNGALQVHRVESISDNGDLSGDKIMGINLQGYEGFDLNTPDDWEYAEWLAKVGKAELVEVR